MSQVDVPDRYDIPCVNSLWRWMDIPDEYAIPNGYALPDGVFESVQIFPLLVLRSHDKYTADLLQQCKFSLDCPGSVVR